MKKLSMAVVNPRAAGIDVGSRFHMVAVDQERENVREFGVCTEDHHRLVEWLTAHDIGTVAMESTGSYWQTLFDALQRAGFHVILASGSQTKNVKGKKSDMLDCLWIQKLHSLGLLSGSFLPSAELQMLRTYYSHRQHLIEQMAKYQNKMQKALRLMNIRLDVAIRDMMGKSGRAIVTAILNGERDPQKLAELADRRVKRSTQEIARALEANWREDLIYELGECLAIHDMYGARLSTCDAELSKKIEGLRKYQGNVPATATLPVKKRNKNSPTFDIQRMGREYFGVDLMQIPGVSHNTVLCLLTQVGNDIGKFPSSRQFCSWLRLAPNNKVTGGKVISSRTPKGKNKLALALRQAANSIGNQKDGHLTRFFKRIAYRKDRASAVTATARKLATIIYNMVTRKENYMPAENIVYSDKARNRMIRNLRASVKKLQLTEEQLQMVLSNSSLSTN